MLKYSAPILIAGLAFSINESFDKILLDYFDVDKAQIGMYAACYKLALFITLFSTAFKLGIEPFIFSSAKNNSPEKAYALILEVFVILGSFILITVVVFIDGAVITLSVNIALIPFYGYLGSAVATFLAYFIMAIISYFIGQHHYPIPYNFLKICTYIALSTFFAFTSFYIFPGNYYFGIGVLILLGLVIIKFEKNTIKLINNEN